MKNRFHNNPPLRYGMVGGGESSQIGDSHRVALNRDSYYRLVYSKPSSINFFASSSYALALL